MDVFAPRCENSPTGMMIETFIEPLSAHSRPGSCLKGANSALVEPLGFNIPFSLARLRAGFVTERSEAGSKEPLGPITTSFSS
jgi:hypothetical protein